MNKDMGRIVLRMDEGWRFHRGEVMPQPIDPRSVYAFHCLHKSNRARGAASPAWDDRNWEVVTLPHDFVIEEEIAPACFSAQGSLPRKNAWYRMHFFLDEAWKGRRAAIEFDGVATKCVVWANGHLVKRHYGAYTGFEADISDVAVYGDTPNTVAVQVLTDESEGWWYEGGGIYRHVRLALTNSLSVARNGVWVNPQRTGGNQWRTQIETTLRNDAYAGAKASLISSVLDGSGRELARAESVCLIPARSGIVEKQTLWVENPALWSPDSPEMHTLKTSVYAGDALADEVETPFGFREVCFSSEGMTVNGVPTKIRGACVHEDYGSLGVAMPDALKEFRLRKLMGMGVNGIRCSHNQQSAEQVNLCDRLGLMVMAEARWFESYSEGLEQLKEMILSQRNHPSIFFWSLGNEEPTQCGETGKRIMRAMRAEVLKLDDSRPCTLAMHTGLLSDGAAEYCDVVGMNYNEDKFASVHARFPERAIIGTEMYSTSLDPEGDRKLGLYTCAMLEKLPYLCGVYIWTGIDYRGEHIYPTVCANAGAIDLNARPRDDYYLYQSMWTKAPIARIHTHWNHRRGETVLVYVYTNLRTAELFLNGKSLGAKAVNRFLPSEWLVPFEEGELKAVAHGDGLSAEHAVRTAGSPARLKLSAPFPVRPDTDCTLVDIVALDKDGVECMESDTLIEFKVEDARLLGACNGDIRDHTQPKETHRRLYRGFCQVAVRPEGGEIRVQARLAEKEEWARISIDASAIRRKFGVRALPTRYITGWKMGGIFEKMPDPASLVPTGWTEVNTDIGASWTFFDYKEIDRGNAEIGAYVPYYAKTVVPEDATVLRLGSFSPETGIAIRKVGEKVFRWTAEVADPCEEICAFCDDWNPGDGLEIFVLVYACHSSDGLNHPIFWK